MSALSTGTDAFPNAVQETAGLYVRKSVAASGVTRSWWAIATRQWVYIFIDSNSAGMQFAQGYFFGDLDSMRPADAYRGAIAAGRIADPLTSQFAFNFLHTAVSASSTPAGTTTGFYVAGTFNQVASSTGVALIQPYGSAAYIGGSVGYAYPHAVNTGLLFGRVLVHEASYTARGWMPSMLAPWHNRALADQTTLPDVPTAGKTSVSKLWCARGDGSTILGEVFFDTTTSY